MRPAQPLYDDPALAAAYARVSRSNVANAAYERPALRAMLGEVAELDVLDAGCAAGEHSAWLTEHGARVVAIDASAAMIALARERLGERARVLQADLHDALPFDGAAFDLVVSSLTLHYLADWTPALREFRRVLRPAGRLVFSTHHPYLTLDLVDDYHQVTEIEERWGGFSAEPVPVRFFHRPFERIAGDVIAAGFVVRRLVEPQPTGEADARDPAFAGRLRTRPGFVVIEAESAAR